MTNFHLNSKKITTSELKDCKTAFIKKASVLNGIPIMSIKLSPVYCDCPARFTDLVKCADTVTKVFKKRSCKKKKNYRPSSNF